jgi:hypothetical protein
MLNNMCKRNIVVKCHLPWCRRLPGSGWRPLTAVDNSHACWLQAGPNRSSLLPRSTWWTGTSLADWCFGRFHPAPLTTATHLTERLPSAALSRSEPANDYRIAERGLSSYFELHRLLSHAESIGIFVMENKIEEIRAVIICSLNETSLWW